MHMARDRSEQEMELYRFRRLKEETTDPIAFGFLNEIVSELETQLKKNTDAEERA
jgi:hypothetical protein